MTGEPGGDYATVYTGGFRPCLELGGYSISLHNIGKSGPKNQGKQKIIFPCKKWRGKGQENNRCF